MKRSTSDRRRVFYIGFLGRLMFKLAASGGEEEVFFDSVILRCHWSMKLAPFGIHVQSNNPTSTFYKFMFSYYEYSPLMQFHRPTKCYRSWTLWSA